MRLGALLPIMGADAANPSTLIDRARMLVDEGFESLWSVQAVGRGFMVSDPLIALAAVAAATERVELGTAVLQVPLYQPVDLAHRVLSLMQLCGDRLTLGVGAGSTRNDFDAFDRDFDTRFATLTSHLEVLRTLFADGRSGGANLSPWAAVVGGPPVLFGSWGAGVERAAAEFDGWIASAMHRSTDEIVAAHSRFRAAGGKRAMVSTIQLPPDVDLGELKDTLARFAEVGFDDAITLFFPGGPAPADVRDLLPS